MIEKMFDFNLEEIMKNSVEATDLNRVCRQIIVDENNKFFDEDYYRTNKDYSVVMNQVVGAEYR